MAILTYLASMVVGMSMNMIFSIDMTTQPGDLPTYLWVVNMWVLLLVTFLFANRYFKGKNIVGSLKNGFLLGVIMLGVWFALDMVFIQLYAMSPQAPTEYNWMEVYQNIWFWAGVVVMLWTTTLVGWKHTS